MLNANADANADAEMPMPRFSNGQENSIAKENWKAK